MNLVSNDFKLKIFFFNFRFYKKSNRTAQSASLYARYGIIVRSAITLPGRIRGRGGGGVGF